MARLTFATSMSGMSATSVTSAGATRVEGTWFRYSLRIEGVPQDDFSDWRRHLETETKPAARLEDVHRAAAVPVLTVLCHADPGRVGEQAWLHELPEGRSSELSRLAPLFRSPTGGEPRPLAEPRLSRRPILLSPRPEGLLIDPGEGRAEVEVDGEPLDGPRSVAEQELDRGMTLLLGGRVTLLLHRAEPTVRRPPGFGLIGESAAMVRLRRQIEAVGDLEVPVLLRGESGTGKELVARALLASSPRRGRPFLSVNMGAVPPSLAAAELFGAAKGAFSGAERQRRGYFREADGGTLFLDEVGETPAEVQALLLRALESGEIQPVGTEQTSRVDVRVIAATDSDLDGAIRRGTFKEPLYHRLRSYEITLPPLRRHLDDLGRLFFQFLRQELAQIGGEERLANRGPYGRPFVPARLLAEMAAYPWPGNVRELRNVARQLVVSNRRTDSLRTEGWLERPAAPRAPQPRPHPAREESPPGHTAAEGVAGAERSDPEDRAARGRYRDPSDIRDEELATALREHRWNLRATAAALGVSRTSLYVLIEESPHLRTAADLTREEIEQAVERVGPGLDRLSETLMVSKQGLKRRMSQLEL